MDWQGQKLANILMQIILAVSTITAFGIGYSISSFQTMMFTHAGGVVLTALITVPNWQFFNHHHLKWLDPSEAERHRMPQLNDAAVAAPKKKATKIKLGAGNLALMSILSDIYLVVVMLSMLLSQGSFDISYTFSQ